jgi:hypothetical protein
VRLWLALLLGGCGAAQLELRGAPEQPFDAVIVPGCPSEPDGSLSPCQMARAVWAAHVWELGWTRGFITSGAAVHSPFVEAEALAAAMAALGVPADRIWLEPNALHTDENIFFSLGIARTFGWHHLAVAAQGAAWDCKMAQDWGANCRGITLDLDWVVRQYPQAPAVLQRVRTPKVSPWMPFVEREHQLAQLTGRHRPPSFLLYPGLALQRTNGERWTPAWSPPPPRLTWKARTAQGSALSGSP